MPEQICQVTAGTDLRASLLDALRPLGGLSAFVPVGAKVLIKPNFNTSDPFPASSDPNMIAALADLIHEAGASRVALGESCTYFLKTNDVMLKCGVGAITAERPWLEVINFDDGQWVSRDIAGARYLRSVSLPACLTEFDRIIILPCLKTHSLARYTGALKLAVGLMKSNERLPLHLGHLQEKVGELNVAYRPDLIVMDARKCFISGGPMTGELREPNLIIAGTSRLAVDRAGVDIIRGYRGNSLADVAADDLEQIRRAREMGVV